jgi:hypothetical protein
MKSKLATDTVASTLSSIADQITSVSLTKTDRRNLQSRNEIVPDELIELICHLADQGNGSILGIPFDATTARTTLAQTSATRTALSVGRQTLQRMEDDMLQTRATVADPAFAIYRSLPRLSKTKKGNALAPAFEQMKAIVKNRPRKRRNKKSDTSGTSKKKGSAAKAAAAVSTATTAPAPTPDTIAAPAASPAPTQAPAPAVVATPSN